MTIDQAYDNYLAETKKELELNTAMEMHPHFNLTKEGFINLLLTNDRFNDEYANGCTRDILEHDNYDTVKRLLNNAK